MNVVTVNWRLTASFLNYEHQPCWQSRANIWDVQLKDYVVEVTVMASTKCWDPEVILFKKNDARNVIMIPNQPIKEGVAEFLKTSWNKAVLRMCIDGGAETLVRVMGQCVDNFVPDYITGDFDSVSKDTLELFKGKARHLSSDRHLIGSDRLPKPHTHPGTTIVHTPDQDDTDFTKALKVLKEVSESRSLQVDHVIVLCSNFDRVDHMMAHFNTLFTSMEFLRVPVFLFMGDSLTWLLAAGKHEISTPKHVYGEWCGLIPLGEPCQKVTTTGLKWNLNNSEMRFGGMVSTSNTFSGLDVVTVETDRPLLWTMALAPGFSGAHRSV
ncbi:thiamin pyrophosphokinase 1-like isoform X2 [Ornithodoros turicata]|uniref:thiamin pyrophosphokinase 1-like isoform X2 n=1 Tax=Ornithodoros turicata TaxID=34597 RepID=UPI003138DE8B